MPIIGTSTTVTSLSDLESLDRSARLSLQQRDGKNTLVATKGTLADGLYSLWAKFCPNQAHDLNLQVVQSIKQTILADYPESAKAVFEKTFVDYNSSPNPRNLTGSKITVGIALESSNKILNSISQRESLVINTLPGTKVDAHSLNIITSHPAVIEENTKVAKGYQSSSSLEERSIKKAIVQAGVKIFDTTLEKLPKEQLPFFQPVLQTFTRDIFQLAQKNAKMDYFATLEKFNEELNNENLSTLSFRDLSQKCKTFRDSYAPKEIITDREKLQDKLPLES